jgi:phage repressor protein C with HTH and peptisase S24 domain
METILQRIKQYASFKNVSIRAFEQSVGMSNGSFASQLKNNKTIGVDKVENILHVYSDLSAEWLFTGKEPMLKSQEEKLVATPATVPGDGIPLIPFDAMAGICNGGTSVMELDCERYVVPVFHGADFLIPVKGSSMYPKYSSGDIVACKKVPLNDLFFQWNKVYVLDTVQGPIIKRVAKGIDQDHISAVSENPKYEPFELRKDQLHAVAIVIGVIRLE